MRISSSVAPLVQRASARPCDDCGPNSVKARNERALEDLKSDKAIEKVREARVERESSPAPSVAVDSASMVEAVAKQEHVAASPEVSRLEATYRTAEVPAESFSTVM